MVEGIQWIKVLGGMGWRDRLKEQAEFCPHCSLLDTLCVTRVEKGPRTWT